jgi:hypothetical protein
MGNEVKETIDLQYLERFDANSGLLQIKLGTLGITLCGPFAPGSKYALYLNKLGTLLALQEDPKGVELRPSGNKAKKMLCSKLMRVMIERGVELPQTADLVEQETPAGQPQIYAARLKMAIKQPDQDAPPPIPRRSTGRVRLAERSNA